MALSVSRCDVVATDRTQYELKVCPALGLNRGSTSASQLYNGVTRIWGAPPLQTPIRLCSHLA